MPIDGRARDHPGERRLFRHDGEDRARHPIELRERVAVGDEALAEDRLDAGEHMLVRGDEERLFVLEMVEETRPLDADAGGDLLHLRTDEPIAGEDLLRGLDDAFAGIVGAVGGGPKTRHIRLPTRL